MTKRAARTKGVGKHTLRYWLSRLKWVYSSANYEKASFDNLNNYQKIDGMTLTEFIRYHTINYRQTWVSHPLQQVIDEIQEYLGEEK